MMKRMILCMSLSSQYGPALTEQLTMLKKAGFDGFLKQLDRFPGCHLLQQVTIIGHHIHQRQRPAVISGFQKIRQRHILCTFLLGPEIHQNFILHAFCRIGCQSGPF